MATQTLSEQIDQLALAADLADGRSDVTEARRVVRQAGGRLRFADNQIVVALAGATGSGKSSLFNALSGTQLATAGVLRPTTATALGASFNTDATALLDWLGVARRHQVRGAERLDGLVLLDLPDHDSTESSHRAEVDRLVKVVDQFVWVVDPQKYADAVLHHDYLRPLAGHHEVVRVVLNQADLLDAADLDRCLADLRRILDAEGLAGVPVLAVSARTGRGVDVLRNELASVVRDKVAATARLRADVRAAAGELASQLGRPPAAALAEARLSRLNDTLIDAANVDVVVNSVAEATRHRGALATGWPFVSWWRRLRPDPLRRLRLGDRRGDESAPVEIPRSSLPAPSIVQDARVASAVRSIGQEAAAGLPDGWRDAVLAAGRVNLATLADRLDQAIVTTNLGVDRGSSWWRVVRSVQWLLMACVLIGVAWLGANVALSYFMLPPLPSVPIGAEGGFRVPLPTVLAIGGAIGGLLLGVVSRGVIALTARAAASRARKALTQAVTRVAEGEIVAPIRQELDRHARAVELVAALR